MSIVMNEISLMETFTQKSFGSTEIRGEFAILNIRCCFGMKGIFLLFERISRTKKKIMIQHIYCQGQLIKFHLFQVNMNFNRYIFNYYFALLFYIHLKITV